MGKTQTAIATEPRKVFFEMNDDNTRQLLQNMNEGITQIKLEVVEIRSSAITKDDVKSSVENAVLRQAAKCADKFNSKSSSQSIDRPRSSAPDWSTVAKIMVPLLTVMGIVFLAIFGLN